MRKAKVKQELKLIIENNSNPIGMGKAQLLTATKDLNTFESISSLNSLSSLEDISNIGEKIVKEHKGSVFITCDITSLERELYHLRDKQQTAFILCNNGKEHWFSLALLSVENRPILLCKDTLGIIESKWFKEELQKDFDIKINNTQETKDIHHTSLLSLHVLQVIIDNLKSNNATSFIDNFSSHSKICRSTKIEDIKNFFGSYFNHVKNYLTDKWASDLVKLSKDADFKKEFSNFIDNIPIEEVKNFDHYRQILTEELQKDEKEVDHNKIEKARLTAFKPELLHKLHEQFKPIQVKDEKNISITSQLEIEIKYPEQTKSVKKIFEQLANTKDPIHIEKSVTEIAEKLGLNPDKMKVFFHLQKELIAEKEQDNNDYLEKEKLNEAFRQVELNIPKQKSVKKDHEEKEVSQLLEEMQLTTEESLSLEQKHKAVKNFYDQKWGNKSLSDIYEWAINIKGKAFEITESLAIMDRANELVTGGHRLRDTQILSTLTFLSEDAFENPKGKLCQISTGEGKTTIVSLLAVIKALRGSAVDVITSSPILAEEAIKDKDNFYKVFGLKAATNNLDPNYKEGSRDCYKNDIVYGTIGNFQFDYLKDSFLGLETKGTRAFDAIILDEVDSMIIDNASHIAKLSSPFPGMESLKYIYINIWQNLQKAEKEVIEELQGKLKSKSKELYEENLSDNESQSIFDEYKDELEATIIPNIKEKIKATNPTKVEFIPSHIKSYAESSIDRWIDSAINAKYNYKEDEQYQLKEVNDELVIQPMDNANTGVTLKNTVWQHGLHQFLQLKHNLQLTAESLTSCFISNLGYINKYQHKNIFGLTGTLGSVAEQELIASTYDVSFSKIPTYKPKNTEELKPWIIEDQNFLEFIALNAQEKAEGGRAVLIICETIKELKKIKQFLLDHTKISVRAYLDEDSSYVTEDHVDSGEVIIATNIAGRGTDFKTTNRLEENGGLHVCVTFLPCNQRVEEQAFGRTGRQGNLGTTQIIVKKSDIIKLGVKAEEINNYDFADFKELRDEQEKARIKFIKETKTDELKFNDHLFAQFSTLYRKLDIKNKGQPEFKYVLEDLKEYWALWLEQKHLDKSLLNGLSSEEIFSDFVGEIKDLLEHSNLNSDYIYKATNYIKSEETSALNLIRHNPYYSIKQAEYFLHKGEINNAETVLSHAISINENPEILYSAYIKLFEVAMEKGGQLKERFTKAIGDVFFISNEKDEKYKEKATLYLNKAKEALQQEKLFLESITNSSDFTNILTNQGNIIDKSSQHYWYSDSDMNFIGGQLLGGDINLHTQFKNRLTFDLIKTFAQEHVLEKNKPIFACYNVGGTSSGANGGEHWLAMIIVKAGQEITILYKDSKGNFANEAEKVKSEFAKHYQNLNFVIDTRVEQKDMAACGIMALKNLEIMSAHIKNFGADSLIEKFSTITFCSQYESLRLRHDFGKFLTDNSNETANDNLLLKHLGSKQQSLELSLQQINSLQEQLSKSSQPIAISARINDHFIKNKSSADTDELKVSESIGKSALTDLAMLGANTTYALKEIHDVHNDVIIGAQLQIGTGIGMLTGGVLFAPSAPIILPMASTLISEGITDVVTEILNQGNNAYDRSNYIKGKAISYGVQILTFGINAALECPKILQKASEACKSLSESLRNCQKFKGVCEKLANHIDEFATWFDRLAEIAKYKNMTQIEQLQHLSKLEQTKDFTKLSKLGSYVDDIQKLQHLEKAGQLQGAFNLSWQLAVNTAFDSVCKSVKNAITQSMTSQIMSKVVNPAFELAFADTINQAVKSSIKENINYQKFASNNKHDILQVIATVRTVQADGAFITILKNSISSTLKASGNWKMQLVGLGYDLGKEYKDVFDHVFFYTKRLCTQINNKLELKKSTEISDTEIDLIVTDLAGQVSKEISNKITNTALKTYNSIDTIKSIYDNYKQAKELESKHQAVIEDIENNNKEGGQLELQACSDKLKRPVKIYENGKLVNTIGEEYEGEAIELDYYGVSEAHPNGHWVPKDEDKEKWKLDESKGGGKKNNCLYDAIAAQTGEDPRDIRKNVVEQIKLDQEKYINPHLLENNHYSDVLMEGGCTNCHDITVSDEEYEVADPDGKMYLVKKTWYKTIKDATGVIKTIGYAVTQAGQVIIILDPTKAIGGSIGGSILAAGEFIIISSSAVSIINELYKSGSDNGVISKAFVKEIFYQSKENLDSIILTLTKTNALHEHTKLRKNLEQIETILNDESEGFNDTIEELQVQSVIDTLRQIKRNTSDKKLCKEIDQITANLSVISKGADGVKHIVEAVSDIVNYNSTTEEIEKSINGNKLNTTQNTKAIRKEVEKDGEYTLKNILTTQELFNQSEQKAKVYYGSKFDDFTNDKKAIVLAYISKNNLCPSEEYVTNYKKNLDRANTVDYAGAAFGDFSSVVAPLSEVCYYTTLVSQYETILSTNDKSKKFAFCKKEKELLLSNGISEQNIKTCYYENDNNCSLMGYKLTTESNIADISPYFYKYNINAVGDILSLRIKDWINSELLEEQNIKLLSAIFINKRNNNLDDLVKEVFSLKEKIILVPLNLYNKHAVGMIFEKNNNLIKVKYLDPENNYIPNEIKYLFQKHNFFLEQMEVEQQKYNNCGPEVIENFMLYLTGIRASQEEAVKVHSRLVENELLYLAHQDHDVALLTHDQSFCE